MASTMTPTIQQIKLLGKEKSDANLDSLIALYHNPSLPLPLKTEVVSSIGRQSNKQRVAEFIKANITSPYNSMDMVYQFYRTCLYNYQSEVFKTLAGEIELFYQNEVIAKMKAFFDFKQSDRKPIATAPEITEPTLLVGDCEETLPSVKSGSVKLIFTSPPYYNARDYSTYKSYNDYLEKMRGVLIQCHRVLESGRFIVINVSPVITKRAGREFESIRYPIHFDFHQLLVSAGFEFIDDIVWLKPEYTVPNRNAGYFRTQMPLSYKPNCVTESIMVYRKKAPFLIDKNINQYNDFKPDFMESIDRTNCWLVPPKASQHHPAVFPELLCEEIIHYYSFPNDLVLDCFAGTGTFGETAKKMDRVSLLCEQHPDYVEHIAKKGYKIISP